jgi:lipoprotein-anchoring transpeptidase ErfK/SrfK
MIKNIDSITKPVKTAVKKTADLKPNKNVIEGYNLLHDPLNRNKGGEYRPSFFHKDIKLPVKKKSKKAKKKRTPKEIFTRVIIGTLKFIFFTTVLSGLLFSGAVYAYKDRYVERAMFGTKLLGEDVGGKTQSEIQAILESKLSAITFAFSVDGQDIVVKPEEAGVTFMTGDTARAAIQTGKIGPWYRPYMHAGTSLLYRMYKPIGEGLDKDIRGNLSMDYSIDEEVLLEFTQGLSTKFNTEAQNAGLVMQGTDVQVIPAKAGRKIVTDSVKKQVADALINVKTDKIDIDVEKVDPDIIEEDTKQSILAAKALLNSTAVYRYKGQTFTPDKVTIAKWIIFNTTEVGGEQKLIPAFDSDSVYSYIYGLASKINIPAVNKKVIITNGANQIVEQEGKDGLAVDVDQASVYTANNLTAGKSVDLELPTYVVKAKTQVNSIIVADWSKYIEINLSSQRMIAYTAGGVIVNSWAITSGASSKGYATPTGTFLIRDKKTGEGGAPGPSGGGVCMPNPPSKSPLCGINYVSYFTGQGHAIHEAWWRSPGAPNDFGNANYRWNGSHGCINATYGAAQFIFYWATPGTPVIIHY